jgi:DNA-binding NarL/FixJ family response regulator
MAQTVLERLSHEGSAPMGPLGNRELEVFDLIGRGLRTSEIAEHLGLSVKTVETYRSNIKSKLDLKDATALIRYATAWLERS